MNYLTTFQDKIKRVVKKTIGNRPYRLYGGLANGCIINGTTLIFPRFRQSKEDRFLKNLDFQNKTVYDIGGYVGIFSLFFSKVVGPKGKIITFEPNPSNYEDIKQNLILNNITNVKVYPKGIGKKKEERVLMVRSNDTGTGSMNSEIGESIAKGKESKFIEVGIDSLDNLFENKKLPVPDFIKIDIEGLEMDALSGMKTIIEKYHPKFHIEVHGVDLKRKLQNVKEIVHFLINHNYNIYHIESDSKINSQNVETAKEGHLFACAKE